MRFFKIFISIALISFSISCTENDNQQNSTSDNYDRSALLTNVVDNIIIPAHQRFQEELTLLTENLSEFNSNRDIETLENLQLQFVETYKYWQHIEMFNIGYAEEIYYASKMNIYPTNVSRIVDNINGESFDLDNNPNQYSAQGFPALDYLLFGLGENNFEILDIYLDNQNDNPTLNYLSLLVAKMQANTTDVINYWINNRQEFINSSGNSASSSLNMLANDFVYYYEKGFRANKIGIPAGVWSGLLPQNVEAYYKKDISKILAKEALSACIKFFNGTHFDGQSYGDGFYDYLAYLDDTNYSSSSMFIGLNDDIVSTFSNADEKLNSLDNNFVSQIESNNMQMLEAYDAIQQGVVRLKTNMLSILGISVDYYDADGD